LTFCFAKGLILPNFVPDMEDLMQYVWRFRLWPDLTMTASDGRRVDIIDPGTLNTGSGPDFFNAKVRVDGQIWAGNVEIHVRASDWHRHNHDNDPAYDNVVLHVVQYDDCAISRRVDGAVIPQVTMRCAADFSDRYNAMVNNPLTELPCAAEIGSLPSIVLSDWITGLSFERLQRKSDDILSRLNLYHGDWNQAIYVTLARGLGFGTNADAMEQLARSLSLKTLLRHHDNLSTVEALLFGSAGLLSDTPRDEYEGMLRQEYAFYCAKFGITAHQTPQWRSRLRPQNSPTRRIALLAQIIHGGFELAGQLLNVGSVADAAELFHIEMSSYWLTHYGFGHPSSAIPHALSASSVRLLLINVVAPLLYAYGESVDDASRRELAVDILQLLKPEENSVINIFASAGLQCRDAFTSQAYIQLRNEYCLPRKCLFCRVGHRLLSRKVKA
jgi:hypothetical protein